MFNASFSASGEGCFVTEDNLMLEPPGARKCSHHLVGIVWPTSNRPSRDSGEPSNRSLEQNCV